MGSAPEEPRLDEILEPQRSAFANIEARLEDTQEELEKLKVERRQIETEAPKGPIAVQKVEAAFVRVDLLWNDWLRLYLACTLLQRVIEEFRERTEAHVLSDAGRAHAGAPDQQLRCGLALVVLLVMALGRIRQRQPKRMRRLVG
jgi:uncharacterized protein YhaN